MSNAPTTPTTTETAGFTQAEAPIMAAIMAVLFWFGPSVFHAAYGSVPPLSDANLILFGLYVLKVVCAPMMMGAAILGYALAAPSGSK